MCIANNSLLSHSLTMLTYLNFFGTYTLSWFADLMYNDTNYYSKKNYKSS